MNDARNRFLRDLASFDSWMADHSSAMSPFWLYDEPHPALRIRRSFEKVQVGIKTGDTRAIDVAIFLICEDPKLPFGKTVKCVLARALNGKRKLLSRAHMDQIKARVAILDELQFPPTELKYIKKLLRKVIP
jgi:hypothetical protein